MILGIGTDIVDVERFRNKVDNEIFLSHVFTKSEIDYCKSMSLSAEHFAVRFAAKESFFKALGTGLIGNFNFFQVEVVNDNSGAPSIKLHYHALEAANRAGVTAIHLTMSHERSYATATVLLEK